MAAADLQRQCHELLDKLKSNQRMLKQTLTSDTNQFVSSLDNNLQTQLSEKKPEYARQKLKSIMKQTNTSSSVCNRPANKCSEKPVSAKSWPHTLDSELQGKFRLDKDEKTRLKQGERQGDPLKETDAMNDYFQSRSTGSLLEGGTDSFLGPASTEDNTQPQAIAKPVTPTAVRRRRIIDRNIHVDSKLSQADLEELERDVRGLNFSYSEQLKEEDVPKNGQLAEATGNTNQSNNTGEASVEDTGLEFHKSLLDRGNNRQLNNFIKDTTIKPKSILNSTQSSSRNYSKQGPGVSFQTAASSSGNSSLFHSQSGDRRLLGYDWIAALVHNEAGLMEESESYFHELREFRRSNRDECCNDFYMDGPFTLTQSEPPEVEQAISETKVKPFTVNERLFTVPVTENLLGEPIDKEEDQSRKVKPTKDQPRFVRVSIPRSTLLLPYKVQAHRRQSFDASDSCSLSEHCLMGWNAVSPATLPTASSVSLTDAMSGVNPRHATTLAEAEKAAATFHWPLLEDPRPKPTAASLPMWRKQYMDTTVNFPHPDSSSLSLSSSLRGSRQGGAAGNLRQKTDALLGSTYSMMYEMQKSRQERELERKQQSGKAAS